MSRIEIAVQDAQATDKYTYVLTVAGKATPAMQAILSGARNVYVSLPPGQLTDTGFVPSDVGITLIRVRAGAITQTEYLHRVDAMKPVPTEFLPGTIFNLMVAIQAYVVQHGSEAAIQRNFMTTAQADRMRPAKSSCPRAKFSIRQQEPSGKAAAHQCKMTAGSGAARAHP